MKTLLRTAVRRFSTEPPVQPSSSSRAGRILALASVGTIATVSGVVAFSAENPSFASLLTQNLPKEATTVLNQGQDIYGQMKSIVLSNINNPTKGIINML